MYHALLRDPLSNHSHYTGITTGRKCDGYEPLPETKPIRFVTLMHVTYPPNELRSFQYFQEKTLSQLFTFIQEDIWTSHIVQTANMDQGIWHSVVALSSFHENFTRHGYSGPENHDRFALKQYNMSIQSILGSERNSSNAHVHLISCILFICIEVLRGREYSNDFIGKCLIQGFMLQLVKGVDPNLATVVAEILDFEQFAWKQKPVFHTLNQVQHALSTLRLELETYNQCGVGMVPVKLRWWRSAFEQFQKEYAEQLTSREGRRGLALLELQGLYVGVETVVFDGPPGAAEDPLRWDAHTDVFREMIQHAEAATQVDQDDAVASTCKGPQFHMHIGVVPLLYGIIHKCRDPSIRRRAIMLMSRSQRLEGVWDSKVMLAVALRAMAVEEQGRTLASSAEIPAASRVRRIAVLPVRQGDYSHANPKSYMVGYEIDDKWAWEDADNILGPRSSES
ncbi:hypothetical protein MY11210_009534 [Beauveria gryllotalpidicola]